MLFRSRHLAGAGWPVYATARRVETLTELAQAGCRVLPLDVTDDDSMRGVIATIERDHGAVGVLINNAGFSQSGAIEGIPLQRAREQFETNVFGPMRLIQLAAPGMRRQRWGRIVNLSSMGGKLTFPGGGYYHATKYAIEALSDVLRFELSGFGIEVVIIEPGLIRTRFGEALAARMLEMLRSVGVTDARVGIADGGFAARCAATPRRRPSTRG